ncbi:HAD hydrolase family protein [bacterium]|nr:HAD hydrolase family protein [bacterium]
MKSGNRGSFPRGFNSNAYSKLKRIALENYYTQKGYDLNRVMYIGNDLNDLEVMRIVGFPIAPVDAHPKIKKIAKLITEAKGGEGVIKELSDYLIIS